MRFQGAVRRALVLGLGCVVALAVVYVVAVCTRAGQRYEDGVLQAATAGPRRAAVDLLDLITGWSLSVAVVLLTAYGWRRGGAAAGLAAGGIVVASVVTAELLQLGLPRPLLLQHGYRREDHSFPSGHVTIAMSVTCALLLVVPNRWRGTTAVLAVGSAVGVGLLTVTASWHRPSDTVGSDLIVLGYVCLAMVVLARSGRLRWSTGPVPVPPVVVLGVGAVAALTLAVVLGWRAAHTLAASPDPQDLRLGSALASGRAVTAAAGLLLALAVLAVLHRLEVSRPDARPARPTTRPTDRVR